MAQYIYIGFKWMLFGVAALIALYLAWLLLQGFFAAMTTCVKALFQPTFFGFVIILCIVVALLHCL